MVYTTQCHVQRIELTVRQVTKAKDIDVEYL